MVFASLCSDTIIMSVNQGTTYGRLPGVRAQVIGGGLATTQIGREQKLVIFGRGDPQNGTAVVNDPTDIQTRVDASRKFGSGTELADGIEKALRNKGNMDFIYGVMPEEIDVQAEPISGGSGTLANAPIVEDMSFITVMNTTTASEVDVEFRYESPPTAPDTSGTVHINPLTGEFAASGTDDYEVDYPYLDWATALDSADQVLNHSEVGVYATLTDSANVAGLLSDKLSGPDADTPGLRHEYKLAMGVVGAQPNATNADGEGTIDIGAYSTPIDDHSIFMPGPVRVSGTEGRTILGGIGGRFAGNELSNPIYGDSVLGYDRLTQAVTRNEEDTFREKNLIPVVDDYRDGGGGISLEGHMSTSTATDWERSFQNRRITDLMLLAQREIGTAARDNLMRDQQLSEIESQVTDVFRRFARAGLIRGNPEGDADDGGGTGTGGEESETPFFVDVTRADTNTIAIASGFSPVSVITGVDETITVADTIGTVTSNTTTQGVI